MASAFQEIAADVVTLISGGTYSSTVTVYRQYLPRLLASEVPATAPYTVFVRPTRNEGVASTRDMLIEGLYSIDVIVMARIDATEAAASVAQIDALLTLIEEIQDRLVSNPVLASDAQMAASYVTDPVYDDTILREDRVFMSVTTFQYRKDRGL